MRKREFAPRVNIFGLVALVQLLSAAVVLQLTDRRHVVYVTAASLTIMLGGLGAYAIQRARFYRRHRRESDAQRARGEGALRRFADSLLTRN